MTERRRLTLGEKIVILQKQALCPKCGKLLTLGKVDWDHQVPLALGGADDETNIMAVHRDCHKVKTAGTHVPLSGDIGKIAKAKRLERKHEEFKARLLEKVPKDERLGKSKWPKRKMRPASTAK